MIKLYGKLIRVNKASQDKKSMDVRANLFIRNLDPDIDEKLLYDTFSAFEVTVTNPKIMRDPETGNSLGFGFISYDSFEASDAAIEATNGQYLCNRQITVSYAYKKDTKGERPGTPAERVLAASNRNVQKSRPHTRFASGPPTLQNVAQASANIASPVPPRSFANVSVPPFIPPFRPPGYHVAANAIASTTIIAGSNTIRSDYLTSSSSTAVQELAASTSTNCSSFTKASTTTSRRGDCSKCVATTTTSSAVRWWSPPYATTYATPSPWQFSPTSTSSIEDGSRST